MESPLIIFAFDSFCSGEQDDVSGCEDCVWIPSLRNKRVHVANSLAVSPTKDRDVVFLLP